MRDDYLGNRIIVNFKNPGVSYDPKRTCTVCFLLQPEQGFNGDSDVCKNCED